MQEHALSVSDQSLPLVVDLDGTLIRSDLLLESFYAVLGRKPILLLGALWKLLTSGRGGLKRWLAQHADIDIGRLPYDLALLEYLSACAADDREVALVSASDHELVGKVADHLGMFSWYQGSTEKCNLKGYRKAQWLIQRLPQGFVYAGDSRADLKVWKHARAAIPVGATRALNRRLARMHREREFRRQRSNFFDWAKALRLHQWAKNTLIFIPLFLSGRFLEPVAWFTVTVGFFAFGLIASGGYIANDLLDLQVDRAHPTKQLRPLAAGRIDLLVATAVLPILIFAGIAILVFINPMVATMGGIYLFGTLAYSLKLKTIAFVDLFTLASLFTLRLAIGISLVTTVYSTWLLTFSMFFFFALSAIKRAVELQRLQNANLSTTTTRRGYRSVDLGIVQAFGVAFSTASLVIFVLYLENDALVRNIYSAPHWLWSAPVLILLWLCRLWAIAARGELYDDPVMFALRDSVSLTIAAMLGAAVMAAHIL